jgi:type I restriction enzyme R subunit
VPPDKPGKTLFFAARDDHADILVDELRKALEAAYGPQPHDLVQKITGSVDDPADKIRRFRNDPNPKYAVTVDLLTTGVDIPEICTIVFVRRVNSRILYEQMIGRATRRADHIGKEIFRIFDAVDIYANLQSVTDMRPIIVDPKITLSGLLEDLSRAGEEEDPGRPSFLAAPRSVLSSALGERDRVRRGELHRSHRRPEAEVLFVLFDVCSRWRNRPFGGCVRLRNEPKSPLRLCCQ